MNEYVYKTKEKSRLLQINDSIMQNINTLYRLRKIQYIRVDNRTYCSYSVSFGKKHTPLKEQTLSFYEHLKTIICSDETLTTENKCFKIIAEGFIFIIFDSSSLCFEYSK